MPESRHDAFGDATVPAGSSAGDSQLTDAELRELLGDAPGETFSEYSDRKLLGLGGMGAVYSGVEKGLNRTVAVKVLRPQYRYSAERIEAFIREARLTAKIDHPNIVPVHRFGVFDDAGVYFTMRRIAGDTLNTIIANVSNDVGDYRRKYTLTRMVGIFLSVCNAMAYAHSRNVMHGDLKPGNIMVGQYGEVLVMDWGLACDTSGDVSNDDALKKALLPEQKGTANDVGGTPAYMAPELITGEITLPDPQSEVYALGAILYAILTLKKGPFDVELSRNKLAGSIVAGKLTRPSKAAPKYRDVPRELEAICLKAMEQNRTKRYKDVEELISEIRNYLDGYPVKAYSPLFIYRLQKRILRKPLIPAMVFVLLVGGIFFYEWNLLEQRKGIQVKFAEGINAANKGATLSYALRRNCRILRNTNVAPDRRDDMVQRTSRNLMLTTYAYESALRNFESVPMPIARNDVKAAISDLVLTERDLNTYNLAREAAMGFCHAGNVLISDFLSVLDRHKKLADLAVKDSTQLKKLYEKLSGSHGTVVLPEEVVSGRWSLDVCDMSGRKILTAVSGTEHSEIKLQAGKYILTFFNSELGSFKMPLLLEKANRFICDLKFPAKPLAPEMAYIAGTENGDIASFCIRKKEVTIAEYIEFWKSVYKQDKQVRRVRFFSEKEERFIPLWDENGKVAFPYKPEDPVFGVSIVAASHYCSWLSEKCKIRVSLPEHDQWQRAAFSFDNGNVSAYGVADLNRNIRELLSSKNTGTFSRNIGFRYVMSLVKK